MAESDALKKYHKNRSYSIRRFYRDTPGIAEIERLGTELRAMRDGKKNQSILITSSISSEGKSTISSILARSLAFHQEKTLLIDFDIRRPRLNQIFNMKRKAGLIETFRNNLPVNTYIRDTPIPNLFLLNSGRLNVTPAEIFDPEKIEYLFLEVGEHYHNIIVDSPPVVPVSDSLLLSTFVDNVILVVKAGSTPKYVVKRAINMFEQVKVELSGIVLNNMNRVLPHYYDYDSYDYHYYEHLRK